MAPELPTNDEEEYLEPREPWDRSPPTSRSSDLPITTIPSAPQPPDAQRNSYLQTILNSTDKDSPLASKMLQGPLVPPPRNTKVRPSGPTCFSRVVSPSNQGASTAPPPTVNKLVFVEYNRNASGKYSCPLCPKVYSTVNNARNHFRFHHPEDGPYQCHLCGNIVLGGRDLERHSRDCSALS
ncbi:hypothetical protein EG329_009301 [Mollisiaceae sp. DMI_Dod_QoI]|nr:hypothetical protein EG329_009301 [Helotiales sp. DMI_Dod_QoI]